MKKQSFTLIELLITISLMSFIFTGTFTLISKFKQNYKKVEQSSKIKKDIDRTFYLINNDFYNSEDIIIKQYNNKTILNIKNINDEFIPYNSNSFYILKDKKLYRLKSKKRQLYSVLYLNYDIELLLDNVENFTAYKNKTELFIYIKFIENNEPFTFVLK